ncbi:hypothetical protein I4U23_011303 [Adineta vaga]|nr:hypothetical protein I4U23_011303 [Adineta vaga]
MRQSELEVNSEIVDVYNSSTTSYERRSVAGGGGGFLKFGVSASYSEQYQQIKHQQGREDTVTIRNEIRYVLANVLLSRSCSLDSQFKSEIIRIGNYIKNGEDTMATYHSQVFVLRYGTHYTSRFLIGGHIVEESFLKSTELYSDETIRKSRQSGARASFMAKFSLSANYGTQVSTTSIDINKYEERVTYRHILSEGGKPFLLGMSLQDWQMTIETNPIILQRTIENITMAIDPKQIPEIEENYVYKAIEKINNAIETFIKMNLIYGCMERTSLSFNWLANIDDGSCAETVANTQFGGFIRTCQIQWTSGSSPSTPDDLCNSFKLSNFHTNTQQCPLGFTQNLLHTLTRTQRIEHQYSYKCGLIGTKRCYRTVYVGIGIVTSYLYSCTKVSNDLLTQYTFGGSFTTNKINSITNTKSCPSEYKP